MTDAAFSRRQRRRRWGCWRGGKGRGEPVAGVDLAAGEDEQGIIVVVADGISDAEAQLIMDRVNLLYPVYVDLHGEGSGVFPGIDQYVTTGYLDTEDNKRCPPLDSII